MLQFAEFWVAVAFGAFILVLAYFEVPKLIGKALDDRCEFLRKEIDDARRLREEAQSLLSDYREEHRNIGQQVDEILNQARRQTTALVHEARTSLKETLDRRSKAVEERIAGAEVHALKEVHEYAINAAASVAERMLGERTSGASGRGLVCRSIRGLRDRLN
jgi:F-type H+-transporting ATPase subunit b